MHRKNYFFIALLFISISILTSCRTMQLNQDGKTLGKGMFESAAGVGGALTATFMGTPIMAPNINVEFQQRFGVAEKVELQLKMHNDFTGMYAPPYGQGFSLQNEFDFSIKVNLYDRNSYALSIMPFIGVCFGMSDNGFPLKGIFSLTGDTHYPLPGYVNPNAGLALIGSKTGLRKNFYWGGTMNFSPNITVMLNNGGLPSFCMDYTFNWGWEIPKDRVVYRHEIGLFCQANLCVTKQPMFDASQPSGNSKTEFYYGVSPTVSIGLSYHFAAAVRYNPGQRQVRE